MTLQKAMDELANTGLANKGTDLGGLLQWAHLHITNLTDALAEIEQERLDAIEARDTMEKELKRLKDIAQGMVHSINNALPCNPYATCAHDITSHVNLMMANGVAPYARAKRKPKVVTT